jgi:hypothetical protein
MDRNKLGTKDKVFFKKIERKLHLDVNNIFFMIDLKKKIDGLFSE